MELKKEKTIVLITSGQPSLNPRLVKEADALFLAGYKVDVIYQYWNDWGTRMDEELLRGKPWRALRVGGSPSKGKLLYWFTRLRWKIVSKLAAGSILPMNEALLGRCGWLLTRAACARPAHLYIAHNLAALPAAVKAAEKRGAKCGFDAEDFHRNEVSDDAGDPDVRLKKRVEEQYFPRLNYLTAASEGIGSAYQQLFPALHPVTIHNVFPVVEGLPALPPAEGTLQLCWFSQTIGPSRGIETLIAAMGILTEKGVTLHLLGNHNAAGSSAILALAEDLGVKRQAIRFYPPIPPEMIFSFVAQFDVGMATETGIPYNREICLTNKLFTYIQSGLAVIASDTVAQRAFMKEYPGTGKTVEKNNAASLAEGIRFYLNHPEALAAARRHNLLLGQTHLNWQTESRKFIRLIRHMLEENPR